MIKFIMLGAPGSGKGTQSKLIVQKYLFKHYSTGDFFREILKTDSELSKKIKSFVEKGLLVPDDIVIDLAVSKIKSASSSYILDGVPRNINQAKMLDEFYKKNNSSIDFAIYLDLPFDMAVDRLTSRRMCPKCNANYNLVTQPSKSGELCDACNTKIIQRVDDILETVKNRIKIYESETDPLIKYYTEQKKLVKIDGTKTMEQIFKDISSVIDSKLK